MKKIEPTKPLSKAELEKRAQLMKEHEADLLRKVEAVLLAQQKALREGA